MDEVTAARCDAAPAPRAIRRRFKGVGELTVYAIGAAGARDWGGDDPQPSRGSGRARAPFVGRTAHLRLVAALARRAARGHGAALLVVGEPGIGKTALLDAVSEARPAGDVVRTDVPLPGDIRPYLPWRPVWRELLFDGRTPDAAALDDAATAVGLPELAPLLDAPLGVAGRPGGDAHPWDPRDRAQATSHVLSALLAARVRPRSAVIVVDDAHRLDELSAVLLVDIMRRAPALPLLVLVGARPDAPVVPAAAEAAAIVRLEGLSPDESRRLARLWGHARPAGDRLGDRLGDTVGRSGGNPLMLKHLLSCVDDPVPPWGSDPTLPLDVRRLVLARLDGLLGDDRLLLRAAAVVGPQFTAATLRAVADLTGESPASAASCASVASSMLRVVADPTGGSPSSVASSASVAAPDLDRELRRLTDLGLLVRGEGAATHRFADPLVREVVYAAASLSDRARLHQAVARHLERDVGGAPSPESPAGRRSAGQPATGPDATWDSAARHHATGRTAAAHDVGRGEQGGHTAGTVGATAVGPRAELATAGGPRAELVDLLAYHYGRSADIAKQREWVGAAARAAERSYATGAALDYLAHLETIAQGTERAALLVRRGAVLALVARWPEAESVLREAVRAAEQEPQAQVATVADARRELGSLLVATTRFAEAITLLTDAAQQLQAAGDLGGAARALDRLAFARFQHGDIEAATRAATGQLKLASAVADDALVAAALENVALTAAARGEGAQALRGLRRAHRIARRLGDPRLTVHVSNDLAGVYAQAGDERRAATWLRRALRAASVIGYDRATAYLTANLGELSRAAGDLDGAREHYVAALRTALAIGDWVTTTQCTAGLAICATRRQHPDHRRLLAQARAVAESLHPAYVLDELEECERALATDEGHGGAVGADDHAVEELFARALAARADP